MDADIELDRWRQVWRASAATPVDLREKVYRETRRRRFVFMLKIGVTIIWGGASVIWAAVTSQRDVSMLAVGVWAFIALSWTFSTLNNRGTAEPAMSTTIGFLDLSIVRCRSALRRIAFGSLAYVVWLAYLLAWVRHDEAVRQPITFWHFATSPSVVSVWGVTACLGAVALWRRHSLKRELQNLLVLRQQMEDPS